MYSFFGTLLCMEKNSVSSFILVNQLTKPCDGCQIKSDKKSENDLDSEIELERILEIVHPGPTPRPATWFCLSCLLTYKDNMFS